MANSHMLTRGRASGRAREGEGENRICQEHCTLQQMKWLRIDGEQGSEEYRLERRRCGVGAVERTSRTSPRQPVDQRGNGRRSVVERAHREKE